MMITNIKHIAVVGIDGCGKSTWSKDMVDFLGVSKKVFGVGDKIFLKDNNSDIEVVGKGFVVRVWQFFWRLTKKTKNKFSYKIVKIIELVLRMRALKFVIKNSKPDIIVSDGDPLVNILAWGSIYYPKIFTDELCGKALGHLTGVERIRFSDCIYYLKMAPEIFLFIILGIRFTVPDTIVFLEISPKQSMKRIIIRGSTFQFHETEKQLEALHGGYFRIIRIIKDRFKINIITQNVDKLDMSDHALIIKQHFNIY